MMMKKYGWVILLSLVLSFFIFTLTQAGEEKPIEPKVKADKKLTAKGIMTKTHLTFFYAGDDMKTMVSMALINKDGKTRQRELVMLRKNIAKGGEQKYFMYFYKPDDVRRTTFMVWKYPVRDDNRWIFIPAVNMVRRIAASDSRSSFVGSDFTYEDLSGRELEADTHTLLHEKKLDDKPCYVIQSVPKTKLDYIRKISWIDKETFLPLKEEYYDLQDKLSRVFTSDKIEKIIVQKEPEEYFWTITNRTMKNIKTGHRTEVTFKKIEYNLGIEDNLFTESNLKEPPNKWIK